MLSGIVRCPICGAGMYGNKSIKKRPDGTNYKDYFYYGCKHRLMTRGHKCTYRNQVNEEVLDKSVAEVVSRLEAEQVTAENIYRVLRSFNSLYKVMDDEERRKLMEALIAEVQIYEDKKETGQWLKSIKFKLPIVEERVDISLDNQNRVECVVLMSKVK